ncbi:MAG: helix-turn-helix transcriptional regulator [Polyangiaceae bacterium]
MDEPTAHDLSSLREILDELDDSGDIDEGLEAALDSIGSAAFVLGANGAVRHANAFGRTLLAADRDAVTEELRSSLASASTGVTAGSGTRYWVSQLARSGEPQYVALLRAMPGDPGPRLRIIAGAWGLTSRQTTVLGLVAQGLANKTISAYLNCAEVTVELHMTALLARSGAASRAELVARFWTFPLA